MRPKVTDAELREIFRLKQEAGVSLTESARKFGVGPENFYRRLRRMGIDPCLGQVRKYSVDDHFFSIIDTETKAYWLGFFLADGCVGNGRNIYLGLSVKDRTHLLRFKAAIKTGRHTVERRKGIVGLGITSAQIVSDLAKLGITPRKSCVVVPPIIEAPLDRHFWRGVIDGDGTIAPRTNQALIAVVGSKATCTAFQAWLARLNIRSAICWAGRIWRTSVTGRDRVKAVCDLLYADATVYLERKKERADYYRALVFTEYGNAKKNTGRRERRLRMNPDIRSRGQVMRL